MKNKIKIRKAGGELEDYSEDKLRNSLAKSGADQEMINYITFEIKQLLFEGIPAKKIYQKAFKLLKRKNRADAARYKLKKAIMELGPNGFAFELLVGEILKALGFSVKINQIIQGHCVSHEVDVVAEKDHLHYMIECKFHNLQGKYCDVKIPLYVNSRFLDIKKGREEHPDFQEKFQQGWLVNNTRFTSDAIKYGECAGLKMISWDYPEKESLKDLIDQTGLHPLTSLTSLTLKEKKFLLDQKQVLCRTLLKEPKFLQAAGIHEKRQKQIIRECEELCFNK